MKSPVLPAALLVVLAWASVVIAMLLVAPLLAIDETRYAGIAWEMLQQHQWLIPLCNGVPYPDKPPFLFWWLMGGWKLFGASITWARAGLALFSLAGLGLVALLARWLWPERPNVAAYAPVVLVSSLLWILFTPLVMFDIAVSFWVLVAMGGLALAGFHGRTLAGWSLVTLGVGAGILTKGPVAPLFVGPAILLGGLWLPPERDRMRWFVHAVLAGLGAGAIALAWIVPAFVTGGLDYAVAVIRAQGGGRVVDAFDHARPIWWYLPLLPLVLFPWSLWPRAWRSLARSVSGGDRASRFLLCWIAPPLIALSLISGKNVHYLMPLMPAFALLLACGLREAVPGSRWDGALVATAVAVPALAVLVIASGSLPGIDMPSSWPRLPAWLPPALLALAMVALWPLRRGHLYRLAGVGAGVVLVVVVGVIGTVAPELSLEQPAAVLARAERSGRPIAHTGATENRFRFDGRLSGPIAELESDEIPEWASRHPDGLVIVYYPDRPRFARSGTEPVYLGRYRGKWLAIRRAADLAAAANRSG